MPFHMKLYRWYLLCGISHQLMCFFRPSLGLHARGFCRECIVCASREGTLLTLYLCVGSHLSVRPFATTEHAAYHHTHEF